MQRADVEQVVRFEHEQPVWTIRQFEEEIEQPIAWQLVAEAIASHGIVGYLCCRTIVDEAEIIKIAVSPLFRRQGIASLMLSAGLKRMAQEDVRSCFLEVRKSNFQALALYRKFLFKQVGVRRNYYSAPEEDALVLSLSVWD